MWRAADAIPGAQASSTAMKCLRAPCCARFRTLRATRWCGRATKRCWRSATLWSTSAQCTTRTAAAWTTTSPSFRTRWPATTCVCPARASCIGAETADGLVARAHVSMRRHYGNQVLRELTTRMLGRDIGEDTLRATWERVYEVRRPAAAFPAKSASQRRPRPHRQRLIKAVDAIDNGVEIADGPLRYKITSDLGARVGRCNPRWNEAHGPEEENARFVKAMAVAAEELGAQVEDTVLSWLPAREITQKGIDEVRTDPALPRENTLALVSCASPHPSGQARGPGGPPARAAAVRAVAGASHGRGGSGRGSYGALCAVP